MLQSMRLQRVRQDLATEQQDGSKRFGRESLKSDSITNLSSHCSLWKLQTTTSVVLQDQLTDTCSEKGLTHITRLQNDIYMFCDDVLFKNVIYDDFPNNQCIRQHGFYYISWQK